MAPEYLRTRVKNTLSFCIEEKKIDTKNGQSDQNIKMFYTNIDENAIIVYIEKSSRNFVLNIGRTAKYCYISRISIA